ncbi:OCIA domain-containing protein 1 [Rana temporaria]|uniref:OCIA domain-containing protein 1 n=1 Tax=Rana temporaria TaxID=8407 RepID=UPI001AADC835|nr:OCIA domain-containing protein 1 [Rana temporaria]
MSASQEEYSQPGGQNTYHLNEEEIRAIKQCRSESFWYRSLPFSALGMVTTQLLLSKGIITTSGRFGTLPKIAFAGFIGYMAGKFSYINVCKEKLMQLQNSPLGEKLRQEKSANARNMPIPEQTPGYSYDNIASSPPVPEAPSSNPNPRTADVPFSASMSESSTTGITDYLAQEPEYFDEKQAKAAPVTYEELRNKNRGAYDVLKPQTSERPIRSRAPKIDEKKNQYGDVWEE